MKVLVTGGAGFIGSHIVESLIQAGHSVAVIDDLSSGHRKSVHSQANFYELDIRDPDLQAVFEKERPEIVSHQAARANVRESMQEPLLYADVNVLGSLNVLECCRKTGVRKIIYASTGGAVYGEPKELPVPEDHPINPLDPYGASKHCVEHYLYLYRINYGLEFTVLRYPNVYGPRQDPFGEAGVVAIFTQKMLSNGEPVINGDGSQERDFIHVSDVARANLLSIDRGHGEIFNLGGGVGCSINRIYELLARATGFAGKKRYGPAKEGEVYRIFLNAGKARDKLEWAPSLSVEKGIKTTVEFFQKELQAGAATTPEAQSWAEKNS